MTKLFKGNDDANNPFQKFENLLILPQSTYIDGWGTLRIYVCKISIRSWRIYVQFLRS